MTKYAVWIGVLAALLPHQLGCSADRRVTIEIDNLGARHIDQVTLQPDGQNAIAFGSISARDSYKVFHWVGPSFFVKPATLHSLSANGHVFAKTFYVDVRHRKSVTVKINVIDDRLTTDLIDGS